MEVGVADKAAVCACHTPTQGVGQTGAAVPAQLQLAGSAGGRSLVYRLLAKGPPQVVLAAPGQGMVQAALPPRAWAKVALVPAQHSTPNCRERWRAGAHRGGRAGG
jgi:hypothetical protein